MDWTQFLMMIIAFIGMFWWNRTSIDALRDVIDSNEKNLRNVIDENARETRNLIQAIQSEIKDFHGRLCSIEERNQQRK